MNSTPYRSLSALLITISLASATASAQRYGSTLYGFGTGSKGPEGIPRTLEMEPPTLGTSPHVSIMNGNPGATALLTYGVAPSFSPIRILGADLLLDPSSIVASQMLKLDAGGAAWLPFGTIPNLRVFTGATVFSQFFELTGGTLSQSNAIAATAGTGCTVSAQASTLTFSNPKGIASFQSINVPPPCTWKTMGSTVARPAAGVTILGRRGVNPNVSIDFNHAGIAAGTNVSIQLEVWCTCKGVVSQHFLFARGKK